LLLKLAWRNIWRNKSRTIITLVAVAIAVVLSVLMMSAKNGVYDNMIKSLIGDFTGFVQVHSSGYWDDKSIDNSLAFNDTIQSEIEKLEGVEGFSPRIESFALVVSDSTTKGALVIGADPEKEKQFNSLHERVVKGTYFGVNDKEVLVGAGLAEYLKIDVNDTLVLLSQGYHGSSAAGKYVVKGLVKFGSPELSKQLIFLPIKEAQVFYGVENMFTNIILHLNNNSKASIIASELKSKIGVEFEVMDWEELAPDLKNMIAADKVEGYVFMFILYMVISFGLFGTMLMMLSERKHEFGVLVAIGMKRISLAMIVWLELIMISILGAILGCLLAFPICAYFYYNPIMLGDDMADIYEDFGIEAIIQFSIDPGIFLQQAIVILIISVVIAVFPFIQIQRMDAIKQMRA